MRLIMGLMIGLLIITPATALSEKFIGYKYTFDLNDNYNDKLSIYGKMKTKKKETKFGVDMKYRDVSKGAVVFLTQDFKF
jgi:hypothetical protein